MERQKNNKRKVYVQLQHKTVSLHINTSFKKVSVLDDLMAVFPPYTFQAFLRGGVCDIMAFCLGEKQGMLVNDEYSFWDN